MLQGERIGVTLAAVVAVALIAGATPADAALNCSEKVKRYDYEVTAAGHNGGPTTLDGSFTSFTYVDFSHTYEAVLRVCKSIAAIRMNKDEARSASNVHRAEYLKDLNEDGSEVRCSWDETLPYGGPLAINGYDFGRAQQDGLGSEWAFQVNQGIGFGDELFRDAYTAILSGEHNAACGENVAMVATRGPDSVRTGVLTAYDADFVWPGVVFSGGGKRNPPRVLHKLLDGRDARIEAGVEYDDHPSGSFVEHGDWVVSLAFKRRGR